ncbi:unnamed protein product [Merluccius merluccius]
MILKPSEGDAGLYTCRLNFSLGGHNYTAARSINLTLGTADHSSLYVCVLVPLTLCLVGLALALGWLFRMELVLAYRRLRGLLISQQVSDGKLYDAYVSYLYSSGGGSSEVVTFALTVLPEVLEKQHGFRLFIRGRDDCPGEALHDVIAGMVSMSRRLVLILSAQSDSDTSPLHPSQSQLAYEHSGMLYLEMMKLLVLLLVFSGMICSEGDQGPLEPTCEMYTDMEFSVTEGEALRIIPDSLKNSMWTHSQHNLFTWHRQSKQGNTSFSDKEEERIHHHGPALLFLPLFLNDSGLYIAQLNFLGKCHTFHVPIRVVSASVPLGKHRLYTPILASDSNVKIPCPEQVADLCKDLKGRLHWFNNSTLRNGENLPDLQLQGPFKTDDIYTCTCTWEHNNKIYNSTASRKLQISGSPQEIKCVAFFGTNIETGYEVWWEKNNYSVSGLEGYNQTFSREMEEPSKKSFFSSTLTINKVQASDLHTSFTCRASHHVETRSHTLHLKPAPATKYFAVDLVLFSRRFLRCTKAHNDGSRYDVYVVYHPQKESKAIQNQFLSQALPLVLEQKCGYRVFIHGRDDISREDRLEQVKERMRLSRRLMVVLTPGLEVNETLGSSSSSPAVVDFDWQLGLHQAMVQEMRVILVQLGEVGPQGNTHLPAPLQRLVHKRVPLYWQEDSPGAAHWNSHFWKRVRYAMPSATTKQSSSVV